MTNKQQILYKVLAGQPIHEIMRKAMPEDFELITLESSDEGELFSALERADFVIAINFDARMIDHAPKLKLIQLAGVGFDGIDIRRATEKGIPVAQTVEGTIIGVAEHTLLLMLAVYKRLIEADASVRRGEWLVWQLRPGSFTLANKTVGIFGLGKIGRAVAVRCRAFETQVIYHDVTRLDAGTERALGIEFVERDELLRRADIVTLHMPLLPETRSSFGANEFQQMKNSAILINTSRGGLIDEAALVRALDAGEIAGAGLDVFEVEPIRNRNHPLFRMNNTVLTPHIATGTRDSVIEKTRAACDNFRRVLEGKRPLNVLNEEVFTLVVK
ncbi:MAG TPA: 2-hydroxyacid dehydrogenase [Pyrinomonadaceae bacterium]|nr:2-hydroxyacid dehydrogenase [Pyrinomonadaceae bacterium]